MTIPAAVRAMLEDLDHPDPDLTVAEAVEEIIGMLVDTGIGIENLLANPAIIEPLGGLAYVRAVLAWRDDSLAWTRSRSRRKGPAPTPPRVPVR